jgi:hypothetical protein
MLIGAVLSIFAAVEFGTPPKPPVTGADAPAAREESVYSTSNPRHTLSSFASDGYRDGPPLCYLPECPPSPIRRLGPSKGVQCISVGGPGNTIEHAVRRPITAGDRYQCLGTSFRVLRCLDRCNGAVIQQERRATNGRVQISSMYVERCRGVVAFSHHEDMPAGIPFDSQMLRGEVGILAPDKDQGC